MSSHYAPANGTYNLKHNFALKEFDQTTAISRFRLILGTFATILFALLFIRILFTFLSIDIPAVLNSITNPFIAPFNGILPEINEFIPIAAMIAYCVYYTMYMVTAWTLKTFAKTHEESPSLKQQLN